MGRLRDTSFLALERMMDSRIRDTDDEEIGRLWRLLIRCDRGDEKGVGEGEEWE